MFLYSNIKIVNSFDTSSSQESQLPVSRWRLRWFVLVLGVGLASWSWLPPGSCDKDMLVLSVCLAALTPVWLGVLHLIASLFRRPRFLWERLELIGALAWTSVWLWSGVFSFRSVPAPEMVGHWIGDKVSMAVDVVRAPNAPSNSTPQAQPQQKPDPRRPNHGQSMDPVQLNNLLFPNERMSGSRY